MIVVLIRIIWIISVQVALVIIAGVLCNVYWMSPLWTCFILHSGLEWLECIEFKNNLFRQLGSSTCYWISILKVGTIFNTTFKLCLTEYLIAMSLSRSILGTIEFHLGQWSHSPITQLKRLKYRPASSPSSFTSIFSQASFSAAPSSLPPV